MQGFIVSANNTTIAGFNIDNIPNSGADGYGIKVTGNATACLLKNNHITHGNYGGIFLDPTTSGCKVQNNVLTYNSQAGIKVMGSGHLIQGNDISHSIQHPSWGDYSGVDADGILFFDKNNAFANNYIHDIVRTDPGQTDPHIDCFQTWANGGHNADNDLFEGNQCLFPYVETVAAEANSCFTTQENTGPIIVENNILNCSMGFFIQPMNAGGSFVIRNNDIIGQLNQNPAVYPSGIWANGATNIVAENNIIYNKIAYALFTKNGGTITGSNNIAFLSNSQAPVVGSSGATLYNKSKDLWGIDPKFVNPGSGDYHLQFSSPALGAGMGGVDIGALP